MSTTNNVEAPLGVNLRRLVPAVIVGNTIEFFDFIVYGTLTAVVFNKVFFPASDPAVGTLLAFTTFAVGFLSRPLGGVIFGHFGDKFGRKNTLIVSMMIMGGSTALMGLLPTYATAGAIAPILLVILRFLQGFGIGGEWGGAVSLMIESAPRSKRGIFGAIVQSGSGLGIILSTVTVTLLLTILSPADLLAWGWRIPLLLSVLLIAIGLIIRRGIDESPEFEALKSTRRTIKAPVWQTLRHHYRTVLLAIGMYIAVAAFGFTQGVFFISYITNTLHVPGAVATGANLVAAVFYLAATFIGGFLSDRIGRKRAYIFGAALLVPAPFIMFWLGSSGSVALLFIGMGIVGLFSGIAYGAQAALFFELFPASLRYTGISLGFQIAAVLGGGLTPIIATLLVQAGGGSTLPVSFYIAALAVLMIICTAASSKVVRADNVRAGIPAQEDDDNA